MDSVKLKFIDPEKSQKRSETLLYWPASHIPESVQFSVETSSKTSQAIITARGHVNFSSSQMGGDDGVNYFIARHDSTGKLLCQPAQMFRMFPSYAFKDEAMKAAEADDESNRLTKREQLDELKEKFGSRKSQRDLASKRKYEIQFGEDDIDNLPTIQPNKDDENNAQRMVAEEGGESEPRTLSTILPPRKDNASVVEDVYALRDIITEAEEDAIKSVEELLFDTIKNEYIKSLSDKVENPEMRLVAIYADLLLQLVKLSASEMRKADPLPLVEGDIKKLLFERYTSTKQNSSRSLRYVITDQNKDRIFVYTFILLLRLNRYRPIELEKLQSISKMAMSNIRRMLELVGCYVENMRNTSGVTIKVARLKLPLNVYKEAKRFKRR